MITTIQNAIITGIRDKLAAIGEPVRDVLPHGGRFDSEELKRVGAYAPAILVTVLGVDGINHQRRTRPLFNLQVLAFIVTRDAAAETADQSALRLTERLIAILPGQRWGLMEQTPHGVEVNTIRATNLYNGALDNMGHALWSVAWKQPVFSEYLNL